MNEVLKLFAESSNHKLHYHSLKSGALFLSNCDNKEYPYDVLKYRFLVQTFKTQSSETSLTLYFNKLLQIFYNKVAFKQSDIWRMKANYLYKNPDYYIRAFLSNIEKEHSSCATTKAFLLLKEEYQHQSGSLQKPKISHYASDTDVLNDFLATIRKNGLDIITPRHIYDQVLTYIWMLVTLTDDSNERLTYTHRELLDLMTVYKSTGSNPLWEVVSKTKVRGVLSVLKHAGVLESKRESGPIVLSGDMEYHAILLQLNPNIDSVEDIYKHHDRYIKKLVIESGYAPYETIMAKHLYHDEKTSTDTFLQSFTLSSVTRNAIIKDIKAIQSARTEETNASRLSITTDEECTKVGELSSSFSTVSLSSTPTTVFPRYQRANSERQWSPVYNPKSIVKNPQPQPPSFKFEDYTPANSLTAQLYTRNTTSIVQSTHTPLKMTTSRYNTSAPIAQSMSYSYNPYSYTLASKSVQANKQSLESTGIWPALGTCPYYDIPTTPPPRINSIEKNGAGNTDSEMIQPADAFDSTIDLSFLSTPSSLSDDMSLEYPLIYTPPH